MSRLRKITQPWFERLVYLKCLHLFSPIIFLFYPQFTPEQTLREHTASRQWSWSLALTICPLSLPGLRRTAPQLVWRSSFPHPPTQLDLTEPVPSRGQDITSQTHYWLWLTAGWDWAPDQHLWSSWILKFQLPHPGTGTRGVSGICWEPHGCQTSCGCGLSVLAPAHLLCTLGKQALWESSIELGLFLYWGKVYQQWSA